MSGRDVEDLALLRGSATHRAALSQLVDADMNAASSEARLLHAVFEAGLRAVRERVEREGYAQIAVEADAPARRRIARRRRPSWADE